MEKQVGSRWYPVESFEQEESWQPMKLPVGQSECTFTTWRRYDTLEHGYYRIVKTMTVHGETVHLAGEFLRQ